MLAAGLFAFLLPARPREDVVDKGPHLFTRGFKGVEVGLGFLFQINVFVVQRFVALFPD